MDQQLAKIPHLCRTSNNTCEVLCKNSVFHINPANNMAVMGNSCFWLAKTL